MKTIKVDATITIDNEASYLRSIECKVPEMDTLKTEDQFADFGPFPETSDPNDPPTREPNHVSLTLAINGVVVAEPLVIEHDNSALGSKQSETHTV